MREPWQARAKCRNAPPELFQPDEPRQNFEGQFAYRRFCDICPVKGECLDTALIYDYPGIWGGLTEKERRQLYSRTTVEWLKDDAIESGSYNHSLKHSA